MVGDRHLVCGNCASWIQHENSGCEKKWADTRVEGFVFTCKGCTEVAALSKEVDGLKHSGVSRGVFWLPGNPPRP